MNLVSLAIKRPIMTIMLILAFVILGAVSYLGLPMRNMPDFDVPFITVTTVYPGASPEEIETNVVKKIEDEVSTISGLDKMTSVVLENFTYTILEFKSSKDVNVANQEVKDKISLIKESLPSDAKEPIVQKADFANGGVVFLSLTTPMDSKDAYEYVDKIIAPKLARIQGVSQVNITGGVEREIKIKLRKSDLNKFMLSPLQIVAAIKKSNVSLPSGSIKPSNYDFSVKVDGEFKNLNDIKNIDIPTMFGLKKLKDVANVIDDVKKIETFAKFRPVRINGKKVKNSSSENSINLEIKKQSDANTVDIARDIISEVAKINSSLPTGTHLNIASDESKFIKNSINDTISSIVLGIVLTGLILLLFMHSLKNTFIIAVTMPVTLISSFLVVKAMGFSINMMTLMALSVSVGTLVSNSVVILENINNLLSKGHSVVKSAEKGTTEMVDAVIAATLTNVVVFLPIAMMSGIIGKVFLEFGVTVTVIMFFAIFIAFSLTPMMASKMLKEKTTKDSTHEEHEKQKRTFGYKFDVAFDAVASFYAKTLGIVLNSKFLSVTIPLIAIITLFLTMKFIAPNLGSEFTPIVDEGIIDIEVELPNYYNIKTTAKKFKTIEQKIADLPYVENISVSIGAIKNNKSPNIGIIRVLLNSAKHRSLSSNDIVMMANEKLADIPDAIIKVASKSKMGGEMGEPIQFEILGDNFKDAQFVTNKIYKILKKQKGAINVDTDIRIGKPEIKIIPNKDKLSFYGLDVYTLALTVRSNIEGIEVSKYKDNGYEYDIKLLMDKNNINDPEKIKNIKILTKKGEVNLSSLAKIEYTNSPSKITRKNKTRMQKVSAYVSGVTTGEVIAKTLKEFHKTVKIPNGITVKQGGMADMQKKSFGELGKSLIIALLLTYMLIAGLLESFLQAAIIMFTFPLAMIGVIWGLYLTDSSLSIISFMAIIMLLGIVVNNAILILDHTNSLMKKGLDPKKAIIKSGQLKLKAITMSTIAIMLGMLPLALGMGEGGEFRSSMGIVSIGGLIASTILTLFIVPAIFVVLMAIKRKIKTLLNMGGK